VQRCGIATVWLIATALLFYSGQMTAGYVLGTMFVGVAALVGTTDICIASIIFNFLVRRRRPGDADRARRIS